MVTALITPLIPGAGPPPTSKASRPFLGALFIPALLFSADGATPGPTLPVTTRQNRKTSRREEFLFSLFCFGQSLGAFQQAAVKQFGKAKK
jgi:hypothetical protein